MNVKHNSIRCDNCKIDIHRASYSRHSKSKKHLEKKSQNKVIIPKKNPTERLVKEVIKVTGTNIENH